MDRLTTSINETGYCNAPYCQEDCNTCIFFRAVLDKLAHYEDLEEQGRLVVMPCKIGDTVWIVGTKCLSGKYELKCREFASCDDCTLNNEFIVFDKEFDWRLFSIMKRGTLNKDGNKLFTWGETVFATKAEAEAKLAEIRGV